MEDRRVYCLGLNETNDDDYCLRIAKPEAWFRYIDQGDLILDVILPVDEEGIFNDNRYEY